MKIDTIRHVLFCVLINGTWKLLYFGMLTVFFILLECMLYIPWRVRTTPMGVFNLLSCFRNAGVMSSGKKVIIGDHLYNKICVLLNY